MYIPLHLQERIVHIMYTQMYCDVLKSMPKHRNVVMKRWDNYNTYENYCEQHGINFDVLIHVNLHLTNLFVWYPFFHLRNNNVSNLKHLCKENNLKKYSKKRKVELLRMLINM